MTEIGILSGMIIWLGLGGWSIVYMLDDAEREDHIYLALACLFLAPFMAGAVIAMRRRDALQASPNQSTNNTKGQ